MEMEMDTNMRQLYKEDAENKKEFSLEFKVTTASCSYSTYFDLSL